MTHRVTIHPDTLKRIAKINDVVIISSFDKEINKILDKIEN